VQALPPQQGAGEEMGEGSARILEALFSVDPTYAFPSKLLSGGHDDDKKDDRYVNINDGCMDTCTYVLGCVFLIGMIILVHMCENVFTQ